jgi:hypothetical protein
MLFREQCPGRQQPALAISQPTHAWISGQLLANWAETLDKPLVLAAEQHDIGWLDWETNPSFDAQTGRPHRFRDIGAAVHAPMWVRGTERARDAWGARVAILISRHGGVIYRRFTDRHRVAEADAAAAAHYLATQAAIEAGWARALGLDFAKLDRDTALVALADTLSLALCGELNTPLQVDAPDRYGALRALRLTVRPERPNEFTLSPWPFRGEALVVEGEARPLPPQGRFASEAAMRAWLAAPERVVFQAQLTPEAPA